MTSVAGGTHERPFSPRVREVLAAVRTRRGPSGVAFREGLREGPMVYWFLTQYNAIAPQGVAVECHDRVERSPAH
jgi:hypothetical protein